MQMTDLDKWKIAHSAIYGGILAFMFAVMIILLSSVMSKINDNYQSVPPATVDSLSIELTKQMDIVNQRIAKDTSKVNNLQAKLDSIDIALQSLGKTIFVLEKQTEIRQNDIRQETNNIINKFNGNIEWWIFLLGLICGVAPILLSFLNHQKDAEYIELLNNHYEKMVEQISQKEMELKKLKTELLHKDKQRRLDWEKKQKELKLIFSFMYIASFTRKAKFQASSVRDNTVEKLLREIVDCSLEYFEFESSEPMKNRQIDISFRIMSALEGMELLRPFIDNPKIGRQMSEVLKSLHRLRERYDKGDIFEHDDVDFVFLKREIKTLKRMKWE